MPPFETWERILGFVVAALSALLAVSLWTRGLARLYPVFTFFLAYGALRSLFVATVPLRGSNYAYFFIVTELVQMTLYILMLLELYSLVFDKFNGIRIASRWTLSLALGVSILLSAASLAPEMAASEKRKADAVESAKKKQAATPEKRPPDAGQKPAPGGQDYRWLLDLFMISERGILLALVLMIIGMSAFLAWYPIELPRNVVVHSMVFAAFFISKAIIILYRNIGHYQVGLEWRCAVMVVGVVCLFIWMGGLRKAGEAATIKVGHLWNRENEEELVAQLKGINAALGRLARE
jgi:hypothetical protein